MIRGYPILFIILMFSISGCLKLDKKSLIEPGATGTTVTGEIIDSSILSLTQLNNIAQNSDFLKRSLEIITFQKAFATCEHKEFKCVKGINVAFSAILKSGATVQFETMCDEKIELSIRKSLLTGLAGKKLKLDYAFGKKEIWTNEPTNWGYINLRSSFDKSTPYNWETYCSTGPFNSGEHPLVCGPETINNPDTNAESWSQLLVDLNNNFCSLPDGFKPDFCGSGGVQADAVYNSQTNPQSFYSICYGVPSASLPDFCGGKQDDSFELGFWGNYRKIYSGKKQSESKRCLESFHLNESQDKIKVTLDLINTRDLYAGLNEVAADSSETTDFLNWCTEGMNYPITLDYRYKDGFLELAPVGSAFSDGIDKFNPSHASNAKLKNNFRRYCISDGLGCDEESFGTLYESLALPEVP